MMSTKQQMGIGCGGVLVLLLLLIVLLAWQVSRTGLVAVPLFSLGYTPPTPTRTVTPTAPQTLAVELASTFARGSLRDGRVELVLSEELMTALVQANASAFLDVAGWVDLTHAQVAVLDDGVELFVPIRTTNRQTAIFLYMTPDMDTSGNIVFLEPRIVIGRLPIGLRRVAQRLVEPLNEELDRQLNALHAPIMIEDILLSEGVVTLTIRVGKVNADL